MIWNLTQPKPEPLFRYDDAGERHYGMVVAGNNVLWFPSVTKIIKATSPTPPGLMAWYAKHGFEDANKLRDDAAERGTEMHLIFERYLGGQSVDMHGLSEFHAKALMSFDQWIKDYEVQPIAVEVLLCSKMHGFAGTADLVCKIKNDEYVMVDFKSGSSVYSDYAVQLEMYRLAWNEYADLHDAPRITSVYNWLPKDWRKAPTYTFKNQTGEVHEDEVEYRCKLYRATNNPEPRRKTIYGGSLPGEATIEVIDPAQVVLDAYARLQTIDHDMNDESLFSVGHS